MLHCLKVEFTVAALCLSTLTGVSTRAAAEPHCPQPAPGWAPYAQCPGYYPCIPNAANYGYFQTVWRPWPTERRPDQTFPESIGREILPTPTGEIPEPLPRQKVEELQPEELGSPGEGVIIEGVPGDPGIRPPLQPGLGGAVPALPLESALPSLDAFPREPAEPAPDDGVPLLPDTSPEDALPAPAESQDDDTGQTDGHGYRSLLLADAPSLPGLPRSSELSSSAIPEGPTIEQSFASESYSAEPAPQLSMPRTKPLALDGYCPVELMEKQLWTQGDPRWAAERDGVLYYFAEESHMQRFIEEPGRFIPVHGGKDPVVLKREKRPVAGQTDYCAIYKDRLYMFSSRDSLAAFRQNPKEYIDPVIRR